MNKNIQEVIRNVKINYHQIRANPVIILSIFINDWSNEKNVMHGMHGIHENYEKSVPPELFLGKNICLIQVANIAEWFS